MAAKWLIQALIMQSPFVNDKAIADSNSDKYEFVHGQNFLIDYTNYFLYWYPYFKKEDRIP